MTIALASALAAGAVGLAIFLLIVRARWFARFEHGFLILLIVTIAGVSFVTASLLGAWSYGRGRTILFQALVDGMRNLGDVVEEQTRTRISAATRRLAQVADGLSPDAARLDPEPVRARLADMQRLDPRFLEITLIDEQGRLVLSSATGRVEPVDRIAAAFCLEGKPFISNAYFSNELNHYVFGLGAPVLGNDHVIGALIARYDIQDDLAQLLGTARFAQSGYAVLIDQDGRVLAHPDPARLRDDLSGYAAVQAAQEGRAGWVLGKNKAGTERLFVYRPVQIPATVNPRPWTLLTEVDADEVLAPMRALGTGFALGAAALLLACPLVGRQVALWIRQPIGELVQFAHHVRGGDLSRRVGITGRDEMAQLGTALNDMATGLEERDRVKELFGRYVTTQISETILKGQLGGERRRVTLLFSDIRDFTAMSETLSPEETVGFLNDYFSEMVEAVFEQSGVLDKFIGDGMLAVFGSVEEMSDHPRRAVLAALRMKALLGKINGERAAGGKPPIAIGIAVHTDDVVVGNIGSRRRLEYTVIGDGVNTCSRLESLNKVFGSTILITETTYAALGDGFDCHPMPEAQLKGKTRSPRVYEVISFTAPPNAPSRERQA